MFIFTGNFCGRIRLNIFAYEKNKLLLQRVNIFRHNYNSSMLNTLLNKFTIFIREISYLKFEINFTFSSIFVSYFINLLQIKTLVGG